MYLREFDLDLPYVANEDKILEIIESKKCTRDEATRIDYEANWKEKRLTFRLQTRCISAMFERIFGKIATKDCRKMLVECIDVVKENRVLNFSGVYTVQIEFDFDRFALSENFIKKKMTLELLMEGIRVISKKINLSVDPFEMVALKIREMDYSNEWAWRKPIKSPDKKYIAEVICQHEVSNIDISIIVYDKLGVEIAREKIISELPDEFAYAKHLGELKWISNNEISLVNKKGDNSWMVKL